MITSLLIIWLVVIAIILAIAYFLNRRAKRMQTDSPVANQTASEQTGAYYGRYNPGVGIVESNSGFDEGLIIGAAMQSRRPPVVIMRETVSDVVIIDNTTTLTDINVWQPVVATPDPSPDTPTFTGFSGGDSSGGGATSSWDSPSDSGSSSYDSGSSYDSSSSSDSSSSYSSDS